MAPPKKYNTNADRLEAKAEQSREYYHKRKYDVKLTHVSRYRKVSRIVLVNY